jgi:cytochrome oxidase Cu insertion factor (SCO1/SenC/PrrC family)
MTRALHSAALGVLLTLVLVVPAGRDLEAQGNQQAKAPEPLKLKVGDTAPDFTLLTSDGQGIKPISLHDFKGKKNVALAFYVFAFTGG